VKRAQSTAGKRAVFLDKDGTLIVDVPYNVDPALVRLTPGAGEGLYRLHEAGFGLWVVTNQSGVARGLFPEAALAAVETRLRELLAGHAVPLDGFLYCPHAPAGGSAPACACRKPEPGLILAAAEREGLDIPASWFVGDILSDIEAGNRAGCRAIIVGREAARDWGSVPPQKRPFAACRDISEAAAVILSAAGEGRAGSAPGRTGA